MPPGPDAIEQVKFVRIAGRNTQQTHKTSGNLPSCRWNLYFLKDDVEEPEALRANLVWISEITQKYAETRCHQHYHSKHRSSESERHTKGTCVDDFCETRKDCNVKEPSCTFALNSCSHILVSNAPSFIGFAANPMSDSRLALREGIRDFCAANTAENAWSISPSAMCFTMAAKSRAEASTDEQEESLGVALLRSRAWVAHLHTGLAC